MAGIISQLYPDVGNSDASSIQGKYVAGMAPQHGQVLVFDQQIQGFIPKDEDAIQNSTGDDYFGTSLASVIVGRDVVGNVTTLTFSNGVMLTVTRSGGKVSSITSNNGKTKTVLRNADGSVEAVLLS